jgi:hypothetical protein
MALENIGYLETRPATVGADALLRLADAMEMSPSQIRLGPVTLPG